MPLEVQTISKKKTQNKNKKENDKLNKRRNGDDGNNNGSDEEVVDKLDFAKLLADMFPSKYVNEKVKKLEDEKIETMKKSSKSNNKSKSKKVVESDEDNSSSDPDYSPPVTRSKSKKNKRYIVSDSESESEHESEDASDSDRDSKKRKRKSSRSGKECNIILTFGAPKRKNKHKDESESEVNDDESGTESENTEDLEEEEDDDYLNDILSGDYNPEEDSEYETESEDETSSNDESDTDSCGSSEQEKKKKKIKLDPKKEKESQETIANNEKVLETMHNMASAFLEMNKENLFVKEVADVIKKRKDEYQKHQKKAEKKNRKSNLSSFRKLLKEGNIMNDLKYFNREMSLEDQRRVLEEMNEVKKHTKVDKPYRLQLLDAKIPPQMKAIALKKINSLRYMSPGEGEYNKLKSWVDAFLQIPFGKYSQLSLSINDGKEACHEFMENARKTLDDAVYGLDDAKLQIMQMLGQWVSNPSAIGSAIAIHGPPGTGKTSIVKDGISKILGREFAFIALGGATDSSFLEGHSYTYEGSVYGKIVDILIHCKTMNPVIYFDELDKVSESPRGEEIIGILTHLTDTSQNERFHDKYFSEIEFDLSKCLFIFSYNDENKVNPILRDRMYRIATSGYKKPERVIIAQQYLIPKILPQVKFDKEEVVIPDETIDYIIQNYCNNEQGVRNLKRCLEIIYTKMNLYRLMRPGTTLFGQKIPDIVSFPITITNTLVKELIKDPQSEDVPLHMYL